MAHYGAVSSVSEGRSPGLVIPANAGIHAAPCPTRCRRRVPVDPRLRGDDVTGLLEDATAPKRKWGLASRPTPTCRGSRPGPKARAVPRAGSGGSRSSLPSPFREPWGRSPSASPKRPGACASGRSVGSGWKPKLLPSPCREPSGPKPFRLPEAASTLARPAASFGSLAGARLRPGALSVRRGRPASCRHVQRLCPKVRYAAGGVSKTSPLSAFASAELGPVRLTRFRLSGRFPEGTAARPPLLGLPASAPFPVPPSFRPWIEALTKSESRQADSACG